MIDITDDPTFGFYNLAHSDVTVFHSFKPKVEMIFMNSTTNITSARETHGCLFPKTKQFFGRSNTTW